MNEGQRCEKCGEFKLSVYRRAEHGQVVCDGCHRDILRGDSPTGLVRTLQAPEYLRKAE